MRKNKRIEFYRIEYVLAFFSVWLQSLQISPLDLKYIRQRYIIFFKKQKNIKKKPSRHWRAWLCNN